MADRFDSPAVAEQRLAALRAELQARGLSTELITSGFWPRLRLDVPSAGGRFADAAFEDNVIAAQAPTGQWCFWWPWIEQIAPADDLAAAATSIARDLGRDDHD